MWSSYLLLAGKDGKKWKAVNSILMANATIFCMIGVGLWIGVGVLTDNPPSSSKSKYYYSIGSPAPSLPLSSYLSQAYEYLRSLESMLVSSQCM